MPDPEVAQRLRLALDMYEFGEQMQRTRLRRLHPGASEDKLDAMVQEWRMSRPSAPDGDAPGRLRSPRSA